jgi:hypothetical protein
MIVSRDGCGGTHGHDQVDRRLQPSLISKGVVKQPVSTPATGMQQQQLEWNNVRSWVAWDLTPSE